MERVLSPLSRSHVVTCVKWRASEQLVQTVADKFGGFDFRLSDTDADNLTDHYEHYRIVLIECFFRPEYRANNVATLGRMPIIYVATDPTDSSSWASMAEARGHDNLITMDDSQGFCVKLRPRVNTYVYSGSAVASGIGGNPWLTTADNVVRHYGIKYAITGAGGALTDLQEWNLDMRYTVQMRLGKSRAGTLLSKEIPRELFEILEPNTHEEKELPCRCRLSR